MDRAWVEKAKAAADSQVGTISSRRGGIGEKRTAAAAVEGTEWCLTCPILDAVENEVEVAIASTQGIHAHVGLVLALHGVSVGGAAAGTDASSSVYNNFSIVSWRNKARGSMIVFFLFQSLEVLCSLYSDSQHIHAIYPCLVCPALVRHDKDLHCTR